MSTAVNSRVLDDAQKAVATALPNDAARSDAADKFIAAIGNNPDSKSDAYVRVKELAYKIRDIRETMLKAAAGIAKFDAAEYKDKDGNTVNLSPKWRTLVREFDDTLQYSLEASTDATAFLKAVFSVLDAITAADGQDLLVELQQFAKQAKHKEDGAHQVKNKFQKFADDIALFAAELDVALEKASEPIKVDVDLCKHKLMQLVHRLKELDAKIHALSTANMTQIAAGASTLCASILCLAPLVILNAIGTNNEVGVALKQAMEERESVLRDIAATEKEMIALYNKDERLQQSKPEVDSTRFAVAKVMPQGDALTNLWTNINTDMHAIAASVEAAVADDGQLSKFLMKKLQASKETYRSFVFLLETYVEQTRSASV